MGKHDPTRDGDVHPDTAKALDPKVFAESGQLPPDEDQVPPDEDDDGADDD